MKGYVLQISSNLVSAADLHRLTLDHVLLDTLMWYALAIQTGNIVSNILAAFINIKSNYRLKYIISMYRLNWRQWAYLKTGLHIALVSKISEIQSSYECVHLPTNFFTSNLFKHLRSCQFTGEPNSLLLYLKPLWKDYSLDSLILFTESLKVYMVLFVCMYCVVIQ